MSPYLARTQATHRPSPHLHTSCWLSNPQTSTRFFVLIGYSPQTRKRHWTTSLHPTSTSTSPTQLQRIPSPACRQSKPNPNPNTPNLPLFQCTQVKLRKDRNDEPLPFRRLLLVPREQCRQSPRTSPTQSPCHPVTPLFLHNIHSSLSLFRHFSLLFCSFSAIFTITDIAQLPVSSP